MSLTVNPSWQYFPFIVSRNLVFVWGSALNRSFIVGSDELVSQKIYNAPFFIEAET